MADKVNNLQDLFLNGLRRSKTPVTMFLVKGVKLQGIITWFDNFSVLLRRDGQAQLIYKHAISTIMPAHPLDMSEIDRASGASGGGGGARQRPCLGERFLGQVRRPVLPGTVLLVNGVVLPGGIAAVDVFPMLLQPGGRPQLVSKHAISTGQPHRPVRLMQQD